MTANLPYCPPIQTMIIIELFFSELLVSDVMLVERYLLVEEKPVLGNERVYKNDKRKQKSIKI